MFEAWNKFKLGQWCDNINVEEFIKLNYKSYDGDESFLSKASEKTLKLLSKFKELLAKERESNGVLNMDTKIVASITSHQPGYLIKECEEIVGLQTDEPLKRALHVYGGIRTAVNACEEYNYHVSENIQHIFEKYRKTHNQGVFDVYTEEMRAARRNGIITGLPDMYGRGRIIGDYRRVALYGIDFLIEAKENEKHKLIGDMNEDLIRNREENTEQINALNELREMAASYGYDISKPASNAKEAIQWLYFGYLGAVKEQNGAAMSLGRVSNFIDIYLEKDFEAGKINESQAQELIDQFVLKLRMVRFARISAYNELFTGDPVWVTEVIGGATEEGNHLVTKTSYRFLHTLYNLDHAPEPNLTILWSKKLPENFKRYCAKVSIDTSSIQYENDDLMRPLYGEDYAISCCVSPMRVGKEMQFFGARANLAKALLYSINGGIDEISKERVTDKLKPISSNVLKYDEVMASFDITLDWLADIYVNALNVIHYMHDKYCYERLEMALHDGVVKRNFATGLAGLSVVADSLSAIKYAKVEVIRENDLAVDFIITGDFPKYGNNDDRVDKIASELVSKFMNKLRKKKTYRNSVPTLSILTITSNVVYGQKTGNTPDGRRAYSPFAPGANPMMKRDTSGALASLLSVAKLPFEDAQDGISNTFNLLPEALGKVKNKEEQINNLVSILDGYFLEKGFHLNVNILDRSVLVDAMHHPEKYPDLTIRVSGYAVKFNSLTKIQQLDVLGRTYHDKR